MNNELLQTPHALLITANATVSKLKLWSFSVASMNLLYLIFCEGMVLNENLTL